MVSLEYIAFEHNNAAAELVKNQKGVVQDCAVVLFGVCEECLKKQAAQ